jgi:hypothetical protein
MKNNQKKSTLRKIVPAFGMLMVSASMLATSTYAWFTMNKEVTVTGMQLNTKVSDNLLISTDTLTSTARKADDTFYNSLIQLSGGLIEPVSTVDAETFYYTAGTNVQGHGDAINDEYAVYDPASKAAFASAYALEGDDATNVVGYVDYVYQLKAINGSTDSEIRLTDLTLTYGKDGANGQKAYRVAIFSENLGYKNGAGTFTNEAAPTGDLTASTLGTILTPSGATNFTNGEAVNAVDGTGTVTYNSDIRLDVGTNRTQYYKIVVRVWLEGEDTTCNNATFMDLTDKWSLDMKWELVADTTARTSGAETGNYSVNNIALAYAAATKVDLTSATLAATATTFDAYDLYKINTIQIGGADLYSDTATITAASHIYKIVDGHPLEVTNQCKLS